MSEEFKDQKEHGLLKTFRTWFENGKIYDTYDFLFELESNHYDSAFHYASTHRSKFQDCLDYLLEK